VGFHVFREIVQGRFRLRSDVFGRGGTEEVDVMVCANGHGGPLVRGARRTARHRVLIMTILSIVSQRQAERLTRIAISLAGLPQRMAPRMAR
jgi:hypothetical protein